MGIASKMSLNFFPKGKSDNDTVLASPDTRFGADVLPEAAAAPAAAGGSAEEAMLRLGNVMQRRAPAAADDVEDEDNLSLPLIGHLSLPRQLRILLVAFAVYTGVDLVRTASAIL